MYLEREIIVTVSIYSIVPQQLKPTVENDCESLDSSVYSSDYQTDYSEMDDIGSDYISSSEDEAEKSPPNFVP